MEEVEKDNLEDYEEVEPEETEEEIDEPEEDLTSEEPEEQKEEPKKPKKPKNKKKKKIIIICSIVAGVLIIALVLGYFLILRKDDTKKDINPKTWQDVLLAEAKDGTLKQTLIDQIDDYNYRTDDIDLMLLDIDSDDDMELISYIEDEITEKKKIVVFEIAKKIKYSKDYDVLKEDALAYAYNVINENMYWYVTNEDNQKVVISLEDKEYTEEDFNMNFHLVSDKYENDEIFDIAEGIDLDRKSKDLTSSIKTIIKNRYTNEEFLDNNNLSKRDIEKQIEKEKEEVQAKLEEEQKKIEEEEQKKALEEKQKQEEEEAKKASSTVSSTNGSKSSSINRIIDETQDPEVLCATAMEEFFEDDNYTYYFTCEKSGSVKVIYNDNTMEKVTVALKSGHIKITDLDRFNITYVKEEKKAN